MAKHIPSLKIGAVNDTLQNAGAILQVDSTSQGSLPIPRMTNAQMLTLGNLVQGLLVDQTDSVSGYPSGVYRYSGSAWVGFGNISGSGLTNNYTTKYNGTNLVNSLIFDNGTNVGIGNASPNAFRILDFGSTYPLGLPYLISPPTAAQMAAGAIFWNAGTSSIKYSNGSSLVTVGNMFFNPGSNISTMPTGTDFQFNNFVGAYNSRNFGYGGSSNSLYLPPDMSMRWCGLVTNGNMKFYEGVELGSTGSPWMGIISPYGALKFTASNNSLGGTNYIQGVIYMNGVTINSIVITKPSDNTALLNVTLVSNRAFVTGSGVEYIIEPLVPKLNGISSSALSNQKYSADNTTTYWDGTGGVGIGHTSQSSSAILQADSTTKGFLPPRMTTVLKNFISQVEGLVVYDTDLDSLCQSNGTTWSTLGNISGSGLTNTRIPYYNGSALANTTTEFDPTTSIMSFYGPASASTNRISLRSEPTVNTLSFIRGATTDLALTSLSTYATINHPADLYLQAYNGTNTSIGMFTSSINFRASANMQFTVNNVLTGLFSTAGMVMYKTVDIQGASSILYAQGGVEAGGLALNASAILQADSTTKGFLPPRMTSEQRVAIPSPATGLLVYQTDVHSGYWYYDGTIWQDLSQPRVGTTASSATPTINTDVTDYYEITGQTVDITSFTTNLTGTPVRGQKLWIDITGTAARAITWGASFEASTIALPTTTVTTNKLSVGFIWNVATSKWRCIGSC